MEVVSMFQRPRSVALEYEKPGTYGTVLIYPLDRLVECGFAGRPLINDVIPTAGFRFRRGISSSDICSRCSLATENIPHCCFFCPKSLQGCSGSIQANSSLYCELFAIWKERGCAKCAAPNAGRASRGAVKMGQTRRTNSFIHLNGRAFVSKSGPFKIRA
ncbi:hypothetical protein PIB30_025827 [Stylosanthes scabra]|uniref:Uncharacterized protein n=1 Tax=Stylosanthes scabra TaxID=79078 RepID=A0ABU6UB84_9FABA|nr:hypothetical protein [Stylosanthes scabra]